MNHKLDAFEQVCLAIYKKLEQFYFLQILIVLNFYSISAQIYSLFYEQTVFGLKSDREDPGDLLTFVCTETQMTRVFLPCTCSRILKSFFHGRCFAWSPFALSPPTIRILLPFIAPWALIKPQRNGSNLSSSGMVLAGIKLFLQSWGGFPSLVLPFVPFYLSLSSYIAENILACARARVNKANERKSAMIVDRGFHRSRPVNGSANRFANNNAIIAPHALSSTCWAKISMLFPHKTVRKA